MRNIRLLISWILGLALALWLVHITLHPWPDPMPGFVKFYAAPGEHVVFSTLSERTGQSLFEPTGRFVAGIAELIAVFLLIIPASRRLGAFLVLVLFGGGLALHLSPFLGRTLILPDGSPDGGMQFLTVVIVFAAALLLLVTHPGPRCAR
jgi:uncharacterized membrane protein YphA (DoxX/SURF4 family)